MSEILRHALSLCTCLSAYLSISPSIYSCVFIAEEEDVCCLCSVCLVDVWQWECLSPETLQRLFVEAKEQALREFIEDLPKKKEKEGDLH